MACPGCEPGRVIVKSPLCEGELREAAQGFQLKLLPIIMPDMAQNTLPDNHFLLITPNLDATWFFDAARAYWQRFRPTVISDVRLVGLVPEDRSIAVTVITRRDRVEQIGVELAQTAPRALFDPIVFDFFEDTQAELNRRAETNQPFGVPLLPTSTPTPGPTARPIYPTPGPIIPRPAGAGLITQTPAPTFPPAQTPGAPADDTPDGPVYPTPGPVSGEGS